MSIRTEIDKAIRTGKDIEIVFVKYDGSRSNRRISDISKLIKKRSNGFGMSELIGCTFASENKTEIDEA